MFPISDSVRSTKFPFINLGLILITCYVFYLQMTNPDSFTIAYSLVPKDVNFGEYITLMNFITSIFLHGGWLHIISNMWFLWIFGDNVEGAIGHFKYLVLYLLSGIAGGLAQYFFMPGSNIPMLGASGAVAGALGAYFLLFPHHKIKTIIPIFGLLTFTNISAFIMLGYWFVLQIFSGAVSIPGVETDSGGVAFWAHVGGFVTGLVLGKLFVNTKNEVIEGEVID